MKLGSVPACAARPLYAQERTSAGRAGDQPRVCVGERRGDTTSKFKARKFWRGVVSAGASSIGCSQGAGSELRMPVSRLSSRAEVLDVERTLKPLTASTDTIFVCLHPERT